MATVASGRICPHCGKVIAADRQRYCNHCGRAFLPSTPAAAEVVLPARGVSATGILLGLLICLIIPLSSFSVALLWDRVPKSVPAFAVARPE